MAGPEDKKASAAKATAASKTTEAQAKPIQATVAQAKALGFDSPKGITIQNGQFVFDKSLAPDRSGFQSVGVAKPGEVQMTPYYGDVTGAYRLSQEQFASAYTAGAGTANDFIKKSTNLKACIAYVK